MKKNKDLSLMTCMHGVVALALGLAVFTTASGGDGIATNTVSLTNGSSGQIASFAAMQSLCGSTGIGSFACAVAAPVGTNALPLQQLSPQAAIQAESIAITSPYSFIRSINRWLQGRRDSGHTPTMGGNGQNSQSSGLASGGGSSTDAYSFFGPFGVSFSGGGGFGDRDNADGQTGFNINTRQANLILDYQFAQDLVGGFAFNYLGTDRTLGLDSGTLNSDSYRFAPFLSYTPIPNSYVTLLGGYAHVDFDSTRKVNPQNFTLTDAQANYGANEYFASLGVGYTHSFDAWSLRGYGRGDYNHLNIGSFQESGGIASDGFAYTTQVNGQSILSATSTLGAELSYAISTNTLAAVVIPKLHAEWVHEFENGGRQIQTTYIATKNGLFEASSQQSIAIAGPQRNWANLGFGVQMLFQNAIVGYINYDTLFIENGSNQTITGGLRVNF